MAEQVLDTKWVIIYIPMYLFGIWNSRRLVMDINKHAILADDAGSVKNIPPSNVGWFESNFMMIRKPGIAAFWSLVFPGLGHLYIHRVPTAFFMIFWVTMICYYSNLPQALHLTVLGDFDAAASVLHAQWFLFFPSMLGFSIFDSYSFCSKTNDLFKAQQTAYFQEHGQPLEMQTNLLSKGANRMNVVASFAHAIYIELAIKELQQNGIHHEDIFVIPLNEKKPRKNMDMIYGGEDLNSFEVTIAMATAISILGAIYGFIWTGGPVVWGVIGLFIGAVIGFLTDLLLERRRLIKKWKTGKGGELMLIIHCSMEKIQMVKSILFDHFTSGISVIDFNKDNKPDAGAS